MASPFSLFRKYMKPMMVVLCGMAMLAFVVVDPLMQYLSASSRGGGVGQDGTQIVVTWKDGELTENELHALVVRRNILEEFSKAVFVEGYYASGREGAEDLGMTVRPFDFLLQPSQGIEREVVATQILADAARQVGMTISDEEVKSYLDQLGRNRVSFDQMKLILARMPTQRRITSQFILDAARDELLKQNYLASYQYSINTVMPEQRWIDWLRANDRVIVEAAALQTSNYMDQVPEPTDSEIREFYDKYKDREEQPELLANTELPSAIPGFQIPRKVKLQYLEGNYEAVLQRVMDSIPEEEIAKYYEENKEYFIKAGSDAAAEASPTDEGPATKEQEGAIPADDDASELFEVPQSEQPAPEPAAEEETPAEAPPESEPEPAQSDETGSDETQSDETQSGSGAISSPFRFVALQEDAGPENSAAVEAPAEESPATPTTETSSEAELKVDEPKDAEPAAPPETPESKPVEYQSLDEVRDEIRRFLAGNRVNEQLGESMSQLQGQLNTAYLSYFDKQLTAQSDKQPEPEPPAELRNLEPLAEPNGLEFHETEELTVLQLRDLPIGKSVDANESTEQRQIPLLYLVFGRLKDYEPVVTRDLDGNRYLVIKTSDIPARVPPLDEIREQVVEAWKRGKASELALTAAKKAAEQIEKDGITIGENFANDPQVKIEVTDPFAWLTRGDTAPTSESVQFRLSEAPPIVAAGPQFMDTVFGLGEGEVAAVLNHDHSIAYVVRVQQHLESRDELREAFLSEVFRWDGAAAMQQGHRQYADSALIGGLFEQADVDWKRQPDERRSDE